MTNVITSSFLFKKSNSNNKQASNQLSNKQETNKHNDHQATKTQNKPKLDTDASPLGQESDMTELVSY